MSARTKWHPTQYDDGLSNRLSQGNCATIENIRSWPCLLCAEKLQDSSWIIEYEVAVETMRHDLDLTNGDNVAV